MRSSVVTKLLKAKQLEYEAVKELMPQGIREHMELSEKQIGQFIRGAGIQIYREFSGGESQEDKSKKRNKSVSIE